MREKILCIECGKYIIPRKTNGSEIYPHRPDLYLLEFFICDTCKNYKAIRSEEKETFIPSKELREYRLRIHNILDPLWKKKLIKRGQAYAYISNRLGYPYHNSQLKDVSEAKKAYEIVSQLESELKEE